MPFDDLMRAWQEAQRKAALRGMPVSREEAMASLYPVYSNMAKANLSSQGLDLERQRLAQNQTQFAENLAQNRDIFNQQIALENWRRGLDEENRSSARPIQYMNVGLSGLGNLGTALYAMKQDDELRRRLAAIARNRTGG